MLRLVGLIAVILCIGATVVADEPRPPRTLADRLDALRHDWTGSSQDTPQGPQASSDAKLASSPGKPRLPRVDTRKLLPKQWYGNQGRQPVANAGDSQDGGGTAGARLLRDVQRGVAITGEPPQREGSAFAKGKRSARPSATTGQPSRATSALVRSIAADVATTLSGSDKPLTQATASKEPSAAESQSEPVADTTTAGTPTVADEPTPTPEEVEVAPKATPKVATKRPAPAAQETARVTVSSVSEKTTTRLPLTIGSSPAAAGPTGKRFATQAPGLRVNAKTSAKRIERAEDEVLVSQQMPVIISRVSGPRSIVVGREAKYRVTIANRGDAMAEELAIRVATPEWADVIGTRASSGSVDSVSTFDADAAKGYVWRMDRLAAGRVAQLEINLIARSGKPIELGVTWEHRPVNARTVVEVQEPKLAIHLAGPDEVLYGKTQLFRLTLSNPGTGPAENVKLRLTPPGGEGRRATSHDIGVIAAGASQSIEVELTAREAGALAVEATAAADGGLAAEVTKEIFCRRAELAVDWRGPEHRYAGASAVYYLRVRNPGTAVAQDVELDVELPDGFEVKSSPDTPQPISGRLTYRVGALRPGDDRYYELRGVMRTPGDNTMRLSATGADDTVAETVTAITEVVALADLKLDVQDPKGPVATSEEIAYQVRVTNRGASEAREVKVVGLFSEGIEPHRAEGGGTRVEINDGRVAFAPVDSIPAGQDRVFTIYARAHVAGTHLFRAEVECRELEMALATEENTRFFEDEPVDVAGAGGRYGY